MQSAERRQNPAFTSKSVILRRNRNDERCGYLLPKTSRFPSSRAYQVVWCCCSFFLASLHHVQEIPQKRKAPTVLRADIVPAADAIKGTPPSKKNKDGKHPRGPPPRRHRPIWCVLQREQREQRPGLSEGCEPQEGAGGGGGQRETNVGVRAMQTPGMGEDGPRYAGKVRRGFIMMWPSLCIQLNVK